MFRIFDYDGRHVEDVDNASQLRYILPIHLAKNTEIDETAIHVQPDPATVTDNFYYGFVGGAKLLSFYAVRRIN
jgi:hypothetical protein